MLDRVPNKPGESVVTGVGRSNARSGSYWEEMGLLMNGSDFDRQKYQARIKEEEAKRSGKDFQPYLSNYVVRKSSS